VNIELKQHVGVTAKPIVAEGDYVQKGQLIAVCEGLGANIHASVYGVVAETGQDAVKIKMDAHQPDEFVKILGWGLAPAQSHLDMVKQAGIVGAGGAGFPAHIKFAADLAGGTFILNGAECEPILGHNIQVLAEQADLIVRGMKYTMEMVNANMGYIAIKPKHIRELTQLVKICKDEPHIEIKFLPDIYPVGDERVIVREILGITLQPGQLPLEVGAVVSNVETIKRVTEAIELGKPVITKDFTVAGRVNSSGSIYLDEPIGMPVKKYIDDCGGYLQPHGEILLGGPFTGKSGDEQSTITKTLGGIFVAMPFPNHAHKFGILACECGGDEQRLREIANGMGGEIVAAEMCKRMVEVNGRYRCDQPGNCPGQSEKILKLKSAGADAVLVGSCED